MCSARLDRRRFLNTFGHLAVGGLAFRGVGAVAVTPVSRPAGTTSPETSKAYGAGYFGEWIEDQFGLPAYHYTCDQTTDLRTVTPSNNVWRSPTDHTHQVGNDRVVAAASNYGYVQVRQDEGSPKFLNDYSPERSQYGGGIGFLTDGKEVLSTFYPGNVKTFDRVFGVGYLRKKVTGSNYAVDQVIFAPFGDDPLLISQVTITNRGQEAAEIRWNQITRRSLPPTFEKAADEWLKGREGRIAASTLRIGKMAIKHLSLPFGDKLLCDITPRNIEAYQQGRLREGAQGRTINIEVQALAQILKANKCWQHLAGEIRSLKERKGIGRALTQEDENLLLARCAMTDSACYTATVLALNSTMRKDEIRKLCWNQVDLLESVLTVGKSKTEAGTGRVIPLNSAARKALADWGNRFPDHKVEHYVFPWCEGGYIRKKRQKSGELAPSMSSQVDPTKPTKGWRTAWRTATRAVECPKCGLIQRPGRSCQDKKCKTEMHDVKSPLAGLRFHDLRHTAITKLAESQASDQTIMAIAGHVSRQMLEHYSHIRMAAKRAALDSISTPLPDTNADKSTNPQRAVHQNGNQIKRHRKRVVAKSLI